jgi:hypothetical protein
MAIACLGWGSLVWDSRNLGVVGDWRFDGPCLPLEFARHSGGDRLTLVLNRKFGSVRALWAILGAVDLERARQQLAAREGLSYLKHPEWIGSWPGDGSQEEITTAVGRWAHANHLDGVVWTALPPKFHGTNEIVPTQEEAVNFLRRLGSESDAAEYVRRAPKQIVTPYRRAMERELEWLRQTA